MVYINVARVFYQLIYYNLLHMINNAKEMTFADIS